MHHDNPPLPLNLHHLFDHTCYIAKGRQISGTLSKSSTKI